MNLEVCSQFPTVAFLPVFGSASKALPSSHSTYYKTLVECGLMLAEYLFSFFLFLFRFPFS